MPDRVAIVTGSTSGIGLAIARRFAQDGSHVLLNGLGDPGAIEALRRALAEEFGVRVACSAADMARPDEVTGLVEAALIEFGRVDILVNNAGIQHTAPLAEFPQERWDAIIAINLSAVFHACKAVLPHMLQRNAGRIINIASVHGLVASPFKAAYVAAKHGVVGLTRVIALETAETGVTCNAICPGWVRTALVERQIEDRAARDRIPIEQAERALLAEKQPSRAFVTPEQIAELALFLCSPAADQITGHALPIDGGWTAQ